MNFEFATSARIVFGAGTVSQAGKIAAKFGTKGLIVTGRDTRRAEPLLKILREAGIDSAVFSIPSEPTIALVSEGAKYARDFGTEIVVGYGGGSAMDGGKAIAALATNSGDIFRYLEVIGEGKPLLNDPLPFMAIPTTAGTGAEVTRNAVLSVPERQTKVSLRSASMLPRVAIVDPELTQDLPPHLTAATGLDALAQLIEPFVCARPNPITDAFSREGMRLCARSLRVCFKIARGPAAGLLPGAFVGSILTAHGGEARISPPRPPSKPLAAALPAILKQALGTACSEGTHSRAREEMALVSLFGGLALANSGLGAVHGFAAAIGGMFPIAHGAICARLLPGVWRANLAAATREGRADIVARFTEAAQILVGAEATPERGGDWLDNLVTDLQIPTLNVGGVARAQFREICAKAERASSMKANPVVLSNGELMQILEQAF